MQITKYAFREKDIVVFETDTIEVFVPRQPHTHASFGGHLVVRTKTFRASCIELTGEESLDMWAAVQACTELMVQKLGATRTNNQDNGNWAYLPGRDGKPRFHFHIYGRSEKEDEYAGPGVQRWGFSLAFAHPDETVRVAGSDNPSVSWLHYIEPYSDEQIEFIKNELPRHFFSMSQ